MKRIFSIFAFALGCIMCAMANNEYRVEIDLGTKEVTVVKDGVAIQGTRHVSPASALLKLSKSTNQEIQCELLSMEDADFSFLPPCRLSKDGTVEIGAFSTKLTEAKDAFKEAMKYLDDSDAPICVYVYK